LQDNDGGSTVKGKASASDTTLISQNQATFHVGNKKGSNALEDMKDTILK